MMRSSQSTAATVFQAWRHRLADKTAARSTMQRVVNRLRGVRSIQAFDAWQTWVQQRQAQKAQLQKATMRMQRLRCSDVLYHWQEHVAQKRALQGRLDRMARCCIQPARDCHYTHLVEYLSVSGVIHYLATTQSVLMPTFRRQCVQECTVYCACYLVKLPCVALTPLSCMCSDCIPCACII